jgi:hypothetical protein
MKKKVLIVFALIFPLALGQLLSQEITLLYNGKDKTNSTINLKNNVEMHVHVRNDASAARNIVVEITDLRIPQKAPTIYTCWNICTYPDNPISLGPINIGAGETNTNNFHVTYDPDGNSNPASITFHVYEEGNSGTYVSLVMDTEHVGISDIEERNGFTVYPNPAVETITIKPHDDLIGHDFVITDILGKRLHSGIFEGGKLGLSVRDYPKGLYFVSVYENNRLIESKKLIIK